MRPARLALLGSACIVLGVALALRKKRDPLPVAPRIDLKRYQGKWFEIARLPARFERNCDNVSAEYSLRNDGSIGVVNKCRQADGGWKSINGTAKLRDPNGPASKLRVRFFWPFWGDYWILEVHPDYKWALVGTPDRRYLWILGRDIELPIETYAWLLSKARELGFDTRDVIRTPQNAQSEEHVRP